MNKLAWLALWSAALVLGGAGCFKPEYQNGGWACGAGESCPAGFECNPADRLCYRTGEVGTPDGGESRVDAGVDARPGEDASQAQCSDGLDNDGDGYTDLSDPGCDSAADSDEHGLAECDNGRDDDSDGYTDLADSNCTDPRGTSETGSVTPGCTDRDLVVVTYSGGTYDGDTTGKGDELTPMCAGGTSPDVAHELFIPGRTDLTLSLCDPTTSFDTILYVRTDCGASDVQCNDDSVPGTPCSGLSFVAEPGKYFVIVEGYGTSAGIYRLSIQGTVQDGEKCDPAQMSDVFLKCNPGRSCTDSGGEHRCM